MKKLKVLILTSKFPRFKGDAQPPFTYSLAKSLLKHNCEVMVIAPHDQGVKKSELFEEIKVTRFQYFIPPAWQRLAYGPGIPANLKHSFLAKLQIVPFMLSQYLAARKAIKKFKPDVVHAHWAFPQGFTAYLLPRPYLITIYGGEVFLSRKYHLVPLLNIIMKKSKGNFALTNGLRNIARGYGFSQKIKTMPLGVDMSVFHPTITGSKKIKKKLCPNGELLILSVGRLVEKKGHRYLLDAYARTLHSFTKSRLVIVGGGPLLEDLKKQAISLQITDRVVFAEEIDHSQLPAYYDAADLFVLPSIIDSSGDRETQGVVFVEAMASKTPVIGTRSGGIPDVISSPQVGLLSREKDAKGLAEHMLALLTDRKKRENLARNAYAHAKKHFVWDHIAAQYCREYQNAT